MSWQQQLHYKQLQLQELHRQQQQQQNQQNQMTEMPSWQNNTPSQMTNPHQLFQGQMTEMPSSWPNMVPNPNPQMLFPPGNMNWAQYGINMNMNPALMNNFQNGMLMQQNSQSQLQPMRNMGMMPQQLDPSIYQTSQFLPMSSNNNNNNNNNSTNNNNEGMMNKNGAQPDAFSAYQQAVPDQGFVRDTAPQTSMQNFLGGSSFSSPPAQSTPPVRATTGGSSLDPEEEKLLYGDDNWIGSLGKSVVSSTAGGGFVNSVEDGGNNNSNFGTGGGGGGGGGGFGSLQSGSWSALMQDALDASSSETGQNEEWSGLTVPSKNEPVPNQSAFQQNQEQSQLGNGIWGQDSNNNNNNNNNSNNLNSQFMQRGGGGQQGMWVPQQSRQPAHNFTNQNQAGNYNNKTNGWNSNNALAQHGVNSNNSNNGNNNNIYGMQPPKNYMSKPNNQEMSGQRRQDESKQESPILFPNHNPNTNPNSVSSGGFSPAQLGMQMGQNLGGNLGMNFGAGNHPFGSFPLLQSQINQQQLVKSQQEQQRFNEPPAQHSDKRDEELNSRGGLQSKDTLFNGAIPLFSQNRIGQPSQNMLELFQKAEKPPKPDPPIPDQSAFDTSSPNHPPQNHQHMQNFGLMLGPPSQRQQQPAKSSLDPDHHSPIPSSSNSQGETNTTDNTDLQNRTPKEPTGTGAGAMFKNVWTNVSTQPRNKIITPSIVQSMMLNRQNANINETNSAGTGTGQAEAGTSSASSAQEERQLFDKNALNAPVGSKRGLNSDENILHGHPLNTNTQQNNYSLLNQVQSTQSADLDAGNVNRLAKRLRPDHGGPGVPPVADSSNNNNKTSVDPHGGMTNFVPREKSEEKSPAGAPSPAGEPTKAINPQMAPSWFEQYRNYRNGQNILSVHESVQRTGPAPHISFPKVPWNNLDNNNIKNNSNNININNNKLGSEQGMERSPVTPISRFGPQTIVPVHNNNINLNNSNNINNINSNNNNAVPMPVPRLGSNEAVAKPPVQSGATPPAVNEKRKTGMRKMVPFHMVTEVPESIISTSMAEMDWAQTANRLFDKVDDENELVEEGQLAVALSRRRLVFTTKLTQHLVPAVPPRFLRAKADSSYESVVYFASNFTLRDACSLICSNKNDTSDENNNTLAEKSEKGGEQFFARVVEASNGRFKKLEEDFIRLNKRTSVLDLQLECQELERFSIVNRLGKFHGRGHSPTDGGPDASASRPFFQRAVTPFPLPSKTISDTNVHCLSI